MKQVFKKSSERGFSLVELMIVVGIIGVLATLALPRFKQFQAKAKMGEAKNILAHVYTLEHSYALDNNAFLNFTAFGANGTCNPPANAKEIGFRIDPCNPNVPRFSYSVDLTGTGGFDGTAATGANAANKVCPGNPAFTITINQNNEFKGSNANDKTGETSVGVVCPD